MEFLKDLWDFMKVRKKFWLMPIIIVLITFGALIIFDTHISHNAHHPVLHVFYPVAEAVQLSLRHPYPIVMDNY